VEQCSSRVVRFERSLKSDRRMDLSSYSGHSFGEGGLLGCQTIDEMEHAEANALYGSYES
jgi:hypothetical protein